MGFYKAPQKYIYILVIVKDRVFSLLPFRHGGLNQRRGRSMERRRLSRLPSLIYRCRVFESSFRNVVVLGDTRIGLH